jgi:hypothetical protein
MYTRNDGSPKVVPMMDAGSGGCQFSVSYKELIILALTAKRNLAE